MEIPYNPLDSSKSLNPSNFAGKYPLRILAIENTLTTPYVVSHFLKHLGYQVITLDTTQNILSRLKKQYFDLMFINLDLLEFAGAFLTELSQEERPPILAMGRLNRPEDYQKHIELGLNDYLNIPISPTQLQLILRHWYFRRQLAGTGLPLACFNTAELLTRIGYNIAALQELSELFADDGKRLLKQVYSALSNQNTGQLKKATHELKGICATLRAKKMKELTVELETTAQQGPSQHAFRLFEQLEQECCGVQKVLNQLQQYFFETSYTDIQTTL